MKESDGQKVFLMGTQPETYKGGIAKIITFIVTEDCNLACTYCYLSGKNKKNKMPFTIAKKAVDYILDNPDDFPQNSVVWEFTGGEPFLEIDLIDKITDYIKIKMYDKKHKWLYEHMFSFSTNGTLYHTPKVQNYIKKNHSRLSIGISIDGNPQKHNLSRIYSDGSGSYDDVAKNVKLWLKQFPNSSPKTTYSHNDLPFLKDSIIHLWNMGIKSVAGNVVFEDVWHDGDEEIFENQLKSLADYIINNQIWDQKICTFFSEDIGFPLTESQKQNNWCGAGVMLAIDYQGLFYPCLRFTPFSLNNHKAPVIGDIYNGYNYDRLRPYLTLDLSSQSSKECLDCNIATGCAWCSGYNYDSSRDGTIYNRANYICKMHKARVRANEYYWNRLEEIANVKSEKRESNKIELRPMLNIMLSNQSVSWCHYDTSNKTEYFISSNILESAIKYAEENFFNITFILSTSQMPTVIKKIINKRTNCIIAPIQNIDKKSLQRNELMVVVDSENLPQKNDQCDSIILQIVRSDLNRMIDLVKIVLSNCNRLNISIKDQLDFTRDDFIKYKKQIEYIMEIWSDKSLDFNPRTKEINIFTDRIFLNKMRNCDAGNKHMTLSPDGEFYLCPAFFNLGTGFCIGNLSEGVRIKNSRLLDFCSAPICQNCDAYQCHRCFYLNLMGTGEFSTPTSNQCIISNIERDISSDMVNKLRVSSKEEIESIPNQEYLDPMIRLLVDRNRKDTIVTKKDHYYGI